MGTKVSEFTELLRGASVNQLAQLFDLDRRTVSNRLKDVQPCGKRNSFPVYKISEVAELLVVGYMTGEKLTQAQKLKHASSSKDFWDSELKRLKYLENTNDLWRTEKVITVFSDVFKTFREAVVVFSDEMEHEADLSSKQIDRVKAFCDALLIETREKLLQLDIPAEGDHETVDDPFADSDSANDSDLDEELRRSGLL